MARKPRIDALGCFHHVLARGNGGCQIFECDADRFRLLDLIADGILKFSPRLHAFCLMGNHFHLALRTNEVPLSKIMQNLMFRYTRYYNRRHGRVGHLFQGRFRSLVVDEESYLLELVRYIHLNPVRSGFAKSPADWKWSSHLAYLGSEHIPYLDPNLVLAKFSRQQVPARKAFERFVMAGISDGHQAQFHTGELDPRIAGGDTFVEKLLFAGKPPDEMPSLDALTGLVCKALTISEKELVGQSRGHRASQARGLIALSPKTPAPRP